MKLTIEQIKKKLKICPGCGSGDISWCQISHRPYCNDCHRWGRVNHRSDEDGIEEWNEASLRNHPE